MIGWHASGMKVKIKALQRYNTESNKEIERIERFESR